MRDGEQGEISLKRASELVLDAKKRVAGIQKSMGLAMGDYEHMRLVLSVYDQKTRAEKVAEGIRPQPNADRRTRVA